MRFFLWALTRFKIGLFIRDEIIEQNLSLSHKQKFNDVEYIFAVPHSAHLLRVKTYFLKDNLIRKWIDGFPEHAIFWDFNGSIGISAVYAARAKESNVFVFEPWLLNMDCLVRNIIFNSVEEKVIIVPTATSVAAEEKRIRDTYIKLTGTKEEQIFSTRNFKTDHQFGEQYVNVKMLSLQLDELLLKGDLILPNYLALDIEAAKFLLSYKNFNFFEQVQSMLIQYEASLDDINASIKSQLNSFGLGYFISKEDESGNRYQIWNRKL